MMLLSRHGPVVSRTTDFYQFLQKLVVNKLSVSLLRGIITYETLSQKKEKKLIKQKNCLHYCIQKRTVQIRSFSMFVYTIVDKSLMCELRTVRNYEKRNNKTFRIFVVFAFRTYLWTWGDSNSLPQQCECCALPDELQARF